jgi:hypothetical protein
MGTKHMHEYLRFSGVCPKLRKATFIFIMSVCLSVRPTLCPHGTTRFPLNGFLWNLMLVDLWKICRDNSCSVGIWQEHRVFYMKTYVQYVCIHVWLVLLRMRKYFRVFEKIKTQILHLIWPPFYENRTVYGEMWKSRLQPGWPKLTIVVMRRRKDSL